MRKIIGWSITAYLIFAAFIIWYILYGAETSIPAQYIGTAADPSTFMNARELQLSEEYSNIRNIMFFLSTPFEWIVMIIVLALGLSAKFRTWAQASSKFTALQTAIYLFWLTIFVTVLTFPLEWLSYRFSRTYHISTQTFASWMKDQFIDFWVNYFLMFLIVSVLYWLLKKSPKRWWFYGWLLSIPFTLFLTFVQPVIIDPLYNDFYPLKNKELEEKILTLAGKADIPAEHVYEVDMSEKTNALNAYVTGIGSNSRIVLWDTTLNRLNDQEILFIMAHEMGHYVMKHIYVGIAGYLLLSLLGLYLTYKIMNMIVKRWGKLLHLSDLRDISSLPLILLIISMLAFASSPLTNAASRYQEHAADKYAIELTGNPEAAITSFQKLTKSGLSQVHPPFLVKLFRYGHPTILERIVYLENYKPVNK
jgi:STE24 endopeptidase